MYQQKQQKKSRSSTQLGKDSSKGGYLSKKSHLPPIEARSSARSRSFHCLQQFTSPKKIKIPDIFYQQIPELKRQKTQNNRTITEQDSVLEKSVNLQTVENDKQQTVMKMHQKSKLSQNEPHMCNFHKQRVISHLQTQEKQQNMFTQPKKKYCCQTEPTEENQSLSSRPKFLESQYQSLQQSLKYSLPKSPQKLKPIKTNMYQKPQLFGPVPHKLLPPSHKSPLHRSFITKFQEQNIIQKLSKPKCSQQCGKRKCLCHNESRLSNSVSPSNRCLVNYGIQKQIQTKKLKINIDRLKKLNTKNSPQDEICQHNMKNRVKQRKTLRKNKKIRSFQRFDTQPFDNDRFELQKQIQREEQQAQSQSHEKEQQIMSQSKITSSQESFIKGIITPSKTTIDQERDIPFNKIYVQKNDRPLRRKLKMAQIEVQTQDILIVKNQSRNSTRKIKSENFQKQNNVNNLKNTYIDDKRSDLMESGIKGVQQIGYTFGSRQNSPRRRKQTISQILAKSGQSSIKQDKQKYLQYQIQYWLEYDVEKNIFTDLMDKKGRNQRNKGSKINLVSSVFKESVLIKGLKKNQQQQEAQQQQLFQKSPDNKDLQHFKVNPERTLEKLTNIPIEIEVTQSKKQKVLQDESRIKPKSRTCISPTISTKSHINMFNRGPKSIDSSRVKKCFKLPRQSQYVQFVKNYKPLNRQIKIQNLVQSEKFKVIPSISKFFFGQVSDESIKHGLGVDMSLNEIFEGIFENGSRKNGCLKKHDGVYQGEFDNNLKNGHGTFKWESGQVFEGEWKMDTKNGHGIWTSPDGSYYEGQWHLNMQHGKGKHVHASGTYEGQFKNFRKQGFGKETFPNGDVFEGEYKNGKPNGKGRYEWKDGSYYEGDFVEGIKQGFGKWHQDANVFYEGEVFNDQKHGTGIQYYKDGRYLEGQFSKGSIKKGKLCNPNKQVIKTILQKFQQNP